MQPLGTIENSSSVVKVAVMACPVVAVGGADMVAADADPEHRQQVKINESKEQKIHVLRCMADLLVYRRYIV